MVSAASALRSAGETAWGRAALQSDPRFQAVTARLGSDTIDDESRVRSIHDLEELHSLAHVMNRTRRRDIGRFTVRDPRTVSVEFTPHQQRLYEAVLEFRREALLQHYDPQVVRLILDMLERQAASCQGEDSSGGRNGDGEVDQGRQAERAEGGVKEQKDQ